MNRKSSADFEIRHPESIEELRALVENAAHLMNAVALHLIFGDREAYKICSNRAQALIDTHGTIVTMRWLDLRRAA